MPVDVTLDAPLDPLVTVLILLIFGSKISKSPFDRIERVFRSEKVALISAPSAILANRFPRKY